MCSAPERVLVKMSVVRFWPMKVPNSISMREAVYPAGG